MDEEDADSECKEVDPDDLHKIDSETEVRHKEKDQEEVHV